MDDDLGLFESLYRRFMELGGFRQPALREDLERELRESRTGKTITALCPHGKTPLTCEECYFDEGNKNKGGWGWYGRR